MRLLALLMLVHVVVIGGFVVARALHAKLLSLHGPVRQQRLGGAVALTLQPALPSGRQLEEYVQAGLVDLRIMLMQAARRGHD